MLTTVPCRRGYAEPSIKPCKPNNPDSDQCTETGAQPQSERRGPCERGGNLKRLRSPTGSAPILAGACRAPRR